MKLWEKLFLDMPMNRFPKETWEGLGPACGEAFIYGIQRYAGDAAYYDVDEEGYLINAPCGCGQCREVGKVQEGHFRCEVPTEELAKLERDGLLVAAYVDYAWRWFIRAIGKPADELNP